ncbi:unannotated protein [freshwater metagenome]|uniref:Unannotated protein n=1 Tax=freshwater metagenome TaxID=449393 RepID=A0A6J7LPJ3_9ZZZZ
MTTDYDDRLYRNKFIGNRIQNRHEVWANDQHFGRCIIDDVQHLWPDESPVDIDAHRVEQRTAVQHFKMFDRVLIKKSHSILHTDTGSAKCLRHLAGSVIQLRPRLLFCSLNQRSTCSVLCTMTANNVCQVVDVVCHDQKLAILPKPHKRASLHISHTNQVVLGAEKKNCDHNIHSPFV